MPSHSRFGARGEAPRGPHEGAKDGRHMTKSRSMRWDSGASLWTKAAWSFYHNTQLMLGP